MTDGQQRRATRIIRLCLRTDPLFAYTILVWYALLLSIIYDSEYAKERITSLACKAGDHRWADTQEYGVEPVCLRCGQTRGYADGSRHGGRISDFD